jgi:SAM-dependent methyltransferase
MISIRAFLFTSSIILIGVCLTLYFQSDQQFQSMNWDEYTNLHYNEERSHSLEEFNQKITPFKLQDEIQKILEKNRLAGRKTRVMEIGSGNGRVLMELKKLFPEVEFYGINKEKTHTFYRRESFILSALKFEIMTKPELEDIELPYVIFQDLDYGARIPYDEDKFDLVYSQNVIRYIKYKFELFNEILRILRHDGESYHTDLPPIHIYDKGVVLDFKDAIGEIRRKGVEIRLLEGQRSIMFKKGEENSLFPLSPHQPVPVSPESMVQEQRRPEMGYNIKY